MTGEGVEERGEWAVRAALRSVLDEAYQQIEAGAFDEPRHPHFAAALSHVVLCVDDALQLLKGIGQRVSLTADVEFRVPKRGQADLTGLISAIRNVIAHRRSKRHEHLNIFLSRMVVIGKSRPVMMIGGIAHAGNPYEDDVAVFWGEDRLLIRRNLYRAIFEANARLPARDRLNLSFDHWFRRSPYEFCGSVSGGWFW